MKKRTFNRECMKKMNGKIKVYKIASYDIETDTSNNMNRFLFGGFIDSNGKYKCFTDKDKMIEYMIKHVDKDTWVYATNNSFDHYALFGHKKDFLKEPPLMRGNLLMNAKYHGINTFDTRSYSKASVKNLGQMLGLPKGEGKFEFYNKTLLEPKHRQMFRRAREYNKRDCEITRQFMIGFQKVLNELGGNLKITIGSCAMDLFKRKYLQEDIQHEYVKTFRDGTFLKDFLSEAYHGGRTEVFYRAVEGVPRNTEKVYYYYDFNSLYPSVMLYAYPKPSSCQLTMSDRGKLNISSIMNFEGCSQIEGVSPYMDYPVLPMVVNKKLCFTIGNIEGVFTHVELRRFLECGGVITKIYKTACYTKTFKPFEKWVTELYNLRLKYSNENNTIYKEIIKLYLNNLYGKFFQRNIMNMEFISLDDRNDDDLSQDGFTFDREIGFGYRETPKESNQAFIIPIFAVYTTAYARLKLHYQLVNLKGLYCDTDSILTETKISTSKNLGDVKLECECNDFVPFKPKDYKFFDITNQKMVYKAKGVRLGDNPEEDFNKINRGEKIDQVRFGTLKEAIRSRGKFAPNERRITTKTFVAKDEKRHWTGDFNENGLEISKPIMIGYKTTANLDYYFRTRTKSNM